MTKEIVCLQGRTGSCRGCDVLAIAWNKAHRNGLNYNQKNITTQAQTVQKVYCPDGAVMQTDLLKPLKRSIW